MLSDDKTGLLKSFLGGLPGNVALRLASAIEADRLLEGGVLPHDAILESLRPALRDGHAARTPTPLRLFCVAFEDLLTSAPRKQKQKASIARSSLLPVWRWLTRELIPAESESYIADARALIMAHKHDEAARRAEAFWAVAGSALEAALANGAARAALADPQIVADLAEMALLLRAGPEIVKLQAILPRPVAQLGEDLLWQVRAVYDALVTRLPDAAPYVAVVTMNRLARPCEALRLPMQICRQTNDTLISKTDMGLVGEILFARMEGLRDAVLTTRHPLFEAETLLQQVSQFADLSSAIVKEIELKRDGEWGQRLLKDRAAVGTIMDGFMERAMKEIAIALPMQKGSGKSADFSRNLSGEKHAMALRYARLVIGSRNFAAAASFAAKQKTVFEEISAYLRRYVEDVVRELRVAGPENRAVAESQFELCIALTALLFSEEEAELLRRRGRAAQAAA